MGETLDLQPLDLAEARVMAEARAASAAPVRTGVGVAREAHTAVCGTLMDVTLPRPDIMEKGHICPQGNPFKVLKPPKQ